MILSADTSTPDTQEVEDQSAWVTFRLTRAERDELRDHAHAARISLSALVRGRVLHKPPPRAAVPTINVQTYTELGRIGKNVNEQTRLCHQAGGVVPVQLQPLVRILVELKSVIDQVRREVIGSDQQPEAAE